MVRVKDLGSTEKRAKSINPGALKVTKLTVKAKKPGGVAEIKNLNARRNITSRGGLSSITNLSGRRKG